MTFEEALAEATAKGVGRCSDAAAMAYFCEHTLQHIVGAVAPQLVWDGARAKDLTFKELGRLANSDVMAVSELQWVTPA
jgi:hypothetical protein